MLTLKLNKFDYLYTTENLRFELDQFTLTWLTRLKNF